jgi:hypothetical protein
MSWTPTDEQRGAVEQALWNASYGWDIKDREGLVEKLTDAVLVAVGPMIAAQALRDAADPKNATWPRGMYGSPDDMFARRDLLNRADHIEKEAGR